MLIKGLSLKEYLQNIIVIFLLCCVGIFNAKTSYAKACTWNAYGDFVCKDVPAQTQFSFPRPQKAKKKTAITPKILMGERKNLKKTHITEPNYTKNYQKLAQKYFILRFLQKFSDNDVKNKPLGMIYSDKVAQNLAEMDFCSDFSRLKRSKPLVIRDKQDVLLQGLRIYNPDGACVTIKNSTNIRIKDSVIGPCGGDAVFIQGSSAVSVQNNHIDDVRNGGYVVSSQNIFFANNDLKNLKRTGSDNGFSVFMDDVRDGYIGYNRMQGGYFDISTINNKGIEVENNLQLDASEGIIHSCAPSSSP